MTKALFTKTVTNVYQYEAEVDEDDLGMFQGRAEELFDTFPEATLVDVTWWVDVEEVNEQE
jgi:predicted dinucleotide-utilizing enzyme